MNWLTSGSSRMLPSVAPLSRALDQMKKLIILLVACIITSCSVTEEKGVFLFLPEENSLEDIATWLKRYVVTEELTVKIKEKFPEFFENIQGTDIKHGFRYLPTKFVGSEFESNTVVAVEVFGLNQWKRVDEFISFLYNHAASKVAYLKQASNKSSKHDLHFATAA